MLGNCSSCNENVGYFRLQDTVCNTCVSGKQMVLKSKLSRVFSFSPFWGFVFVAGFVAHFIIIGKDPIVEQIALSSGLMILALVSFSVSFLLRFYLCRRRMHFALALAVSFPFAAIFSTIIGVAGTSPASLTTLGFIFFPFYVLRLPNLSLETGEKEGQQ